MYNPFVINYNNLYVNKVESTNTTLIYHYKIIHHITTFEFIKLIDTSYKKINHCFFCNKKGKYYKSACKECYYFSFDKYYTNYWKNIDLFNQNNELVKDVKNIIIFYSFKLLLR